MKEQVKVEHPEGTILSNFRLDISQQFLCNIFITFIRARLVPVSCMFDFCYSPPTQPYSHTWPKKSPETIKI